MSLTHFDYIVIGGGSGGYAAARTAREARERVAIVDSAKTLGGLCILNGCMPSKTLIYSAEVLYLAQLADRFGLNTTEATANMPNLNRRKNNLVKEFAEYRQQQLQSERFTLFRNRAQFIDPDTIELDNGQRLTADYFMISTGSIASEPPINGLAGLPYWTSDDVLNMDFLPQKIIILGGGVIACELGQFLRRIGSEVVQIQRSPQILKETSTQAAQTIQAVFEREGIRLYTDTKPESVSHTDGLFTVQFTHKGQSVRETAPYLLNALGRQPASEGLGLQAAGIRTKPEGYILCDEMQRTTNPKVYACGDVSGPHQIVHTAIMQGELAAKHATGRTASPINYDHLLTVVFTDPQIGIVGLGERPLKERKIPFVSADYPFEDHGKSILMEARHGYVKLFAAKETGLLLGAECVGKEAGELIHAMAVAVTMQATVHELLKVHWYHPTLSEIWSYPLETISEQLETPKS